MKKISFKLSAVLLLTLYAVSCAKEPDLGTVSLDPSSKTVTFGQVFNIKPVFSATGEAKNKTYTWKSSADSIASIKMVSGGFGEVTPKRIGQATMTYASTDGKITKTAIITVDPRSTILNGIYFKNGATQSEINNNMLSGFSPSTLESTSSLLVFASGSSTVSKLIYELDTSNKLKALYVILNNTADNKKSAEDYLAERFMNTGKSQGGILYYKNTGYVASNSVPLKTALGLFLDQTINATQYPLGVKIMDGSNL